MRFITIACAMLATTCLYGQSDISYEATYYVDGAQEKEQYRSHTSLESVEQGASVVYATNGVNLILTKMRLNKTSGVVNDAERRENGHNSVVLIDKGSDVLIEFCEINSHTMQADGVTARGTGTKVTIVEGNYVTSRKESAALNAVDGAVITMQKPKVYTYSNQSALFHTGVNGTISVTEPQGESMGQGSPLFYSMGVIEAQKCLMKSAKWVIGCVDGGKLQLTESEIESGEVAGFLLHGNFNEKCEGELILTKNSLSIPNGPLLFITNTHANITLTNNKISSKSDDLMWVKADDWGHKGSNGGHAHVTAQKQSLNGDILIDSISSLHIELLKGSSLNGRINADLNPCAEARVVIDTGAKWSSKGESYVTSIEFKQPLSKALKQLKGNHVIYYDASDPINAYLEGKEHKTGGGVLRPLK